MANLFDIGKSGLSSYRQALSVTGQNIANINTEGYKRREANLEEIQGGTGSVNSIPAKSGLGVRVTDVRRSFDEFLLNKARSTSSYAEASAAYSSNISTLEDVLLPGDHNLGSMIANFFDGLQEVSVAPSDRAPRTVALEQANALSETFRQLAKELKDVQNGTLRQIDQKLSDLNGLSAELANLNRAIGAGTGPKSNSALDARDALIDKISHYVDVTITQNEDGTKSLTLGESGSGPSLVSHDRFATLKVINDDLNVNYLIGEGQGYTQTNQIKNGSLQGLSVAYSKAAEIIDHIDSLAFSFVRDVNSVHENGINLEGDLGGKFFKMVELTPVENPKNLGSAVAMVEVTDYTLVNPELLEFTYDQNTNFWTGRNTRNEIVGSGSSRITLPGLLIEFNGEGRHGDKYTIKPGAGSASAFGLAITRPHDIAAASKLLSSSDPNNESASTMAVSNFVETPIDIIPNINEVMSDGLSAVASTTFLRDGPAVIIPSNVSQLDLASLTQQAQVNFSLSSEKMKGLNVMSFSVTDQAGNTKKYSFDIGYSNFHNGSTGHWGDMSKVANLLNMGSITGTNDVDGNATFSLDDIGAFASGSDGQLSISFSKSDLSDDASISLSNSNPVGGLVTKRSDVGSDMQIFTREGRHIAGSEMTADEISDLFTRTNGFFAGATYVDTYLNKTGENGYLGATVSNKTNATDILTSISEEGSERTITFDSLPNIDGNEGSVSGRSASARTIDYSLTIDGLTENISAKNLTSFDSASVAAALVSEFRSNAPIANLTGQLGLTKSNSITVSEAKRNTLADNNSLSFQFDDVSYQLKKMGDGSIAVTSSNENTLSLSYDPTNFKISEVVTTFPEDGDKVIVSFEGQDYAIEMRNGEVYVTGGEKGRLSASFNSDYKLHIWSNEGTLVSADITLPTSATVPGNTEAAARFGLTNGATQPIASLTQQTIPFSITEATAGTGSSIEIQEINGLNEAALAQLVTKPFTLSDRALNLRIFAHDVSVTTEGSTNVIEMQSIEGFDVNGLNDLAGQTITISDGVNSIRHKFNIAPSNIVNLVTSLKSATGYSNLNFDISEGSDELILTYKSSGPAATATYTQNTSAITLSFPEAPTVSELAEAIQNHDNYADLDFTVAAGTEKLILTYKTNGDMNIMAVAEADSFYDRDFNIRLDGDSIIATNNITTENLSASATADSLVGQRIIMSNMPDEELILVLTGQASRKISANYDQHPAGTPVMLRDVSINVTDAENGIVEFIDTETNTSMATRTLNSGQEAAAKGFDIKLSGNLQIHDKFHIATNNNGVGDGRNLQAIIALQPPSDDESEIGGFQEVFGSIVANLGSSVRTSKLTLEAANALRDAAIEAEASYSGVNLDTEASRLLEQQQAYQASARILSTARELFQTLMQSI